MDNLADIVASFNKRRILITGDTGFKGSWLALWLAEAGANVVGFALPADGENALFHTLGLANRIRHVDGDIRHPHRLATLFAEFQPEIVFHLAAQALVRRSYQVPTETHDINIMGSVNVLEAVRCTPSVRSLIYVTSDKCYRNHEWVWGYRETDELGGHDPYSASKAAAEIVFSSYSEAFFRARKNLGAASVRAGNVIGGGDWSMDRIVPDCIRALSAGLPIVLRRPNATRPWQHVLEPLSGYLRLAAYLEINPLKYSGAWNFGPQSEAIRTVEELARAVVHRWGNGEVNVATSTEDPHEAGRLHLNCDKARNLLQWRTRWDFRATVVETVDWYREILRGGNVLNATISQIQRYSASSPTVAIH